MELIQFLVASCALLCAFSAFQIVVYVRLKRRYAAALKAHQAVHDAFVGERDKLRADLKQALEAPPAPPPKETLEITAQDLLHDLTRRGQAVLRVEVIDPANILLRSARG